MGLLACVSGQRGVFPCATVWSPQSHSTMCAGNTLCISIKRSARHGQRVTESELTRCGVTQRQTQSLGCFLPRPSLEVSRTTNAKLSLWFDPEHDAPFRATARHLQRQHSVCGGDR